MAQILKSVANEFWLNQKLADEVVTEIPVNTLVEEAIKRLLSDEELRLRIKKSYEKCGFVEINEEDAVKKWLATKPEERSLVPLGVVYNPKGISNINMAFNGPKKGSQSDKIFANADRELLKSYFDVFKDHKDEVAMAQKKKRVRVPVSKTLRNRE